MVFLKRVLLGLGALFLILLGLIIGLIVLYVFAKMAWRAMGCLPSLFLIAAIVVFILYAIGAFSDGLGGVGKNVKSFLGQGAISSQESMASAKVNLLDEEDFDVSISENLSNFDILTNSPYNGFDYTHHIAMTYCIVFLSDSEKEISEYVNDRSGSVENDSLGYKWISIDSFCEKNASPLVIKVCELINNKKSFEIIEYVI